MSRLAIWVVSWAASAVLLSPLWGATPPENLLGAVNVYAWFTCVLYVIAALFSFSKSVRESAKKNLQGRSSVSSAIGLITSLAFLGATAYVGWIGMFGVLLVCWMLTTVITAAD